MRVLTTSLAIACPRRTRWTAYACSRARPSEQRRSSRRSALDRSPRTRSPLRSRRSGSPFTSKRRPPSRARGLVRSRSSAFSGRCPMPGRVAAQAARCRVLHRVESRARSAPFSARVVRHEAAPNPVELVQHVVGEAPGRMSHSTRSTRERGEDVGLFDLEFACRRSPSASRPGTTRTLVVWSQIAR